MENNDIEPLDPIDNGKHLYTDKNLPTYETLRQQAVYGTLPVSSENIRVTRMRQLNKLQTLGVANNSVVKEPIPESEPFFKAYKMAFSSA